MIVRISGKLVEKKELSVVLNVQGIYYEVMVPVSVLARIETNQGVDETIELVTYHYLQIGPASGLPIIIGFINEIERDFFLQFIKVSGIGPRAAVKALNKPISEITQAIDAGDIKFLKTLPGIGLQRAKEVVAKLQGKVSKYGLIQDRTTTIQAALTDVPDWQDEALAVLLQLQYKTSEASDMIEKAMKRSTAISTTEDLLNEIYKQRMMT